MWRRPQVPDGPIVTGKSYWDKGDEIETRLYQAHLVQQSGVGPDEFVAAWQALHGWES